MEGAMKDGGEGGSKGRVGGREGTRGGSKGGSDDAMQGERASVEGGGSQ